MINLAVAFIFLLGSPCQSWAWMKPGGEFEDFFSILKPKDNVFPPSKALEEPLRRTKREPRDSPGGLMPFLLDTAGGEDTGGKPMGMASEKNGLGKAGKDMGVIIDFVGSFPKRKSKPNEKMMMSFSEMFVPYKAEDMMMKAFNIPGLFDGREDFPRALSGLVPLLMSDLAMSHPQHKGHHSPPSTHTCGHLTSPEPNSPFEGVFSFITQQFNNLTKNEKALQDPKDPLADRSTNILRARSVDKGDEDDDDDDDNEEDVVTKLGESSDSGGKKGNMVEMKMETVQDKDRRYKLFSKCSLGYLTIVIPLLAGLVSTIIGIEILRRNRDLVCKKCPFSHYNQIEHC